MNGKNRLFSITDYRKLCRFTPDSQESDEHLTSFRILAQASIHRMEHLSVQ